ncbi:hypothetical protein PO124_31915 [Bacillus licheniformis]|nr:hypothetical protein [Bacillus licheniformis]
MTEWPEVQNMDIAKLKSALKTRLNRWKKYI